VFVDNANNAFIQSDGPVASIKKLIREEDFLFSFDFMPWAFRAVDIAATVTGNSKLKDSRDAIISQYGTDPNARIWMVGADGEYVG
jgi:hypothetical protein